MGRIADLIARAGDVGGIIDGVLDTMRRELGFDAAILLLQDHPREVLATLPDCPAAPVRSRFYLWLWERSSACSRPKARRMAFRWEEEIALTLLAQHAAACPALLEKSAAEPAEPAAPVPRRHGAFK